MRHADTTSPTLDWLLDVASDVDQWAVKHADILLDSINVLAQVGTAAAAPPAPGAEEKAMTIALLPTWVHLLLLMLSRPSTETAVTAAIMCTSLR